MDTNIQVGDRVSSFILQDITDCPDYNGKGYLFKHEKTGFEVFFFSTPDKESFFTYTIFTPPEDNSGVFHILEHTLLTGSKRYPVRDPFMDIDRNSVNTFLNAMTGPDRTYYPAASPLKKDFDNIFAVYTDAVFNPLLRKESFMQEGIRLTHSGFEGVVFSEMKGDVTSHSSVVFNTSNRYLFEEGSPYTFESGGDPVDIVDLTYEKALETYKKYYVPANMTLFLYGEVDIEEKLEFLDREYLSHRDGGKRIARPLPPKKWDEERKIKKRSDAEEGDEGASITLSWLLGPSLERGETTTASLVVDVLLSNPGCPLYKAIIDSGIGKDISDEGGLNDSYSSLTFSTGFMGADEKDGEKAGAFILETLQRICDEGIDSRLIESSLRRMEFRLQEIKEGTPNGYRLFFKYIDRVWAYGGNPASMLSTRSEIDFIRLSLKKDSRFLEHWIENNLINNPHRLLSVVVMDSHLSEERTHILEEKYSKGMKSYSEEEEKAYLRFEETPDSEEAIKSLPRLRREDIPVRRTRIERKVIDGVLVTPRQTNGICYGDFVFDISDLTIEELEKASILSRMLSMTNVGDMSYSEFLREIKFSTGAFSSIFESGTTCSGEERDFILIRFKSLDEYYLESLKLIYKLLTEGDFSSSERVNATLRDIESDYENSLSREAHLFALSYASRSLSPSLFTAERTQGISFWLKVIEYLKGDVEKLCLELGELAGRIFTRERLTFHLVTDKGKEEHFASLTKAFVSSLPSGTKGENAKREIEDDGPNTALTFSSPVSYISMALPSPISTEPITGAMRVFLSTLSRSSLWALEREKGGAYGSGASLDINENIIYFYTYRDPRLDKSIDDFFRAVEIEELTDEKIEDTILRALSKDIKPTGPQSRGIVDLRRYLYGITDEMRWTLKDNLLATTVMDAEKARGELLSLMRKNAKVAAVTSTKALKGSGRKWERIKLPFSGK